MNEMPSATIHQQDTIAGFNENDEVKEDETYSSEHIQIEPISELLHDDYGEVYDSVHGSGFDPSEVVLKDSKDDLVHGEVHTAESHALEHAQKRIIRNVDDFYKDGIPPSSVLERFYILTKQKIAGQRNEIRRLQRCQRRLKGKIVNLEDELGKITKDKQSG